MKIIFKNYCLFCGIGEICHRKHFTTWRYAPNFLKQAVTTSAATAMGGNTALFFLAVGWRTLTQWCGNFYKRKGMGMCPCLPPRLNCGCFDFGQPVANLCKCACLRSMGISTTQSKFYFHCRAPCGAIRSFYAFTMMEKSIICFDFTD